MNQSSVRYEDMVDKVDKVDMVGMVDKVDKVDMVDTVDKVDRVDMVDKVDKVGMVDMVDMETESTVCDDVRKLRRRKSCLVRLNKVFSQLWFHNRFLRDGSFDGFS